MNDLIHNDSTTTPHTGHDFNSAENMRALTLIPHHTFAKVQLHLKAGGYNDAKRGWLNDLATMSLQNWFHFFALSVSPFIGYL